MQKEIFEQPVAIMNTLDGRIKDGKVDISAIAPNAAEILSKVEHANCGLWNLLQCWYGFTLLV